MGASATLWLTGFALVLGMGCHADADDIDGPLSGLWSSDEATRCEDGQTVDSRIGEVRFEGASFDVTYVPFEVYRDYWGTYEFDATSGAIRFEVGGGNKPPPPSQDLDGVARLAQDTLVLEELSLGSSTHTAELCGHVLTRR